MIAEVTAAQLSVIRSAQRLMRFYRWRQGELVGIDMTLDALEALFELSEALDDVQTTEKP